jgi:hypothetical protein
MRFWSEPHRHRSALTKNLDNWICISWTEPTERFWKAASRIKLLTARSHAVWTGIMKSDFSIGDRVQISALGALRCPRIADRTGTIVGRSIYVNCARVLLDGNKSPTTINLDYLKEILSVNAEVSAL